MIFDILNTGPESRSLTGVPPPLPYDMEDLIEDYLCGMTQLPSYQQYMGGMKINPEVLEKLGRLAN